MLQETGMLNVCLKGVILVVEVYPLLFTCKSTARVIADVTSSERSSFPSCVESAESKDRSKLFLKRGVGWGWGWSGVEWSGGAPEETPQQPKVVV